MKGLLAIIDIKLENRGLGNVRREIGVEKCHENGENRKLAGF